MSTALSRHATRPALARVTHRSNQTVKCRTFKWAACSSALPGLPALAAPSCRAMMSLRMRLSFATSAFAAAACSQAALCQPGGMHEVHRSRHGDAGGSSSSSIGCDRSEGSSGSGTAAAAAASRLHFDACSHVACGLTSGRLARASRRRKAAGGQLTGLAHVSGPCAALETNKPKDTCCART